MGRAAKLKAQRKEMRQSPKFLKEVAKATNHAIGRATPELTRNFLHDNGSLIGIVLYEVFGFGPVRLERFFDEYAKRITGYKERYEVGIDDTPWICERLLKEKTGWSFTAWEKKIEGDMNGTLSYGADGSGETEGHNDV